MGLATLLHRRRAVEASAARRRRYPLPVPPSGALASYAGTLRELVDELDAITLEALREEHLVPHETTRTRTDADGDPPGTRPPHLPPQLPLPGVPTQQVARVTRRMRQQIAALLKRKPLLARVSDVGAIVARHTRAEWQRQIKSAHGVDLPVAEPDLVPAMESFRRENTDLIVTLTESHVDRVREVLSDAGSGTRVEEIARSIRESTDATRARANLIARDQVLKLNAEVTQKRHEAAGVTEYIWRTSRDERVRRDHKALDGTRQRYDDPPVVDQRRGDRANPGTYYQCRCTAEPIIPGFDT